MKLHALRIEDAESPDFVFFCPGCKCAHGVWTSRPNSNGAQWAFNGDFDKPTFSPSIDIAYSLPQGPGKPELVKDRCHFFVREGFIEFCSDTTHALTSQTVLIPDWEKSI